MTKRMGLMALGLSMALLSGCGSSSSDDKPSDVGDNPGGGPGDNQTVTGIFQDANVAGLNYACSSGKNDVTNGEGQYTCNVGDTVEFSLGGYVLGSVTASSGIVTPVSLYPNDPEAATDVLQLLQTLDSGEDGTITIPDGFSALDSVGTRPGDTDFDAEMENELGEALVSEEDAQAHMLETLLKDNTLYTTIYDEVGTMESWSFNDDLSSATWTELVGGSATGTGTLSVDGMTLIYTCTYDSDGECEVDPTTIEVKEILADYLVVEVSGGDIPGVESLRLYYDESKARAYFLSEAPVPPAPIVDMKAQLSGQILYRSASSEGEARVLVVDETGESGVLSGINDYSDHISISYDDSESTITVTNTDPGEDDTGVPNTLEIKVTNHGFIIGGDYWYYDEELANAN